MPISNNKFEKNDVKKILKARNKEIEVGTHFLNNLIF